MAEEDEREAANSARRAEKLTQDAERETRPETRKELVDSKPDLVQRFVDASIIGWYNYIYGDNKAANDMIKKMNP